MGAHREDEEPADGAKRPEGAEGGEGRASDAMFRRLAMKLALETSPADVPDLIGAFGYLRAKCEIYLRKGPADYRRDDYFHVPRAEWTAGELAGIERGFRQIANWNGLTADAPLEDVDLADLYRIVEVTHFRLEDLAVDPRGGRTVVVTLRLRHRMDGRILRLCYQSRRAEWTEMNKGSMASGERTEALRDRPAKPGRNGQASGTHRIVRWAGRPPAVATRSRPVPESFGYTPGHPILCWEPLGEFAYLGTIHCPNGHPFSAHRLGSMSGVCPDSPSHSDSLPAEDGRPLHCIVDKYCLECHEGEHTCQLYFDMYHREAPRQRVPAGLKPADPARAN